MKNTKYKKEQIIKKINDFASCQEFDSCNEDIILDRSQIDSLENHFDIDLSKLRDGNWSTHDDIIEIIDEALVA